MKKKNKVKLNNGPRATHDRELLNDENCEDIADK